MELYVTGAAGFSGSAGLYLNEETRKKLLDHYPKSFFTVFGENIPDFPGIEAAGTEKEPADAAAGVLSAVPGVRDLESAGEGGVFGALWRLLKRNRLGARFSQRAIPVRQQTVEICEFLGIDPYRLTSEGCTVWLTEDPAALLKKAEEAGICCERIGLTEKGPAIRRTDGATVAYLRRPVS